MFDYTPLDDWCRVPTWYTGHKFDLDRRKDAVDELIRQPGFDVAEAVAYVRANAADGIWPGEEAKKDAALREFETYLRQRLKR